MNEEEKIIMEVLKHSRFVQDYIWGRLGKKETTFDINIWVGMFQKRVDKIKQIDTESPSYKTELRKRVLQQAALSIRMLQILDTGIAKPKCNHSYAFGWAGEPEICTECRKLYEEEEDYL